ncbi:MFS transporter [Candidatus Woesearchaeota archaeon]|nr:MFS transporter [Candidatus Woesearchaeota archaeon]
MNRIIKLLILSDIFVVTGFGLIEPILAIFIKENLIGGTIFAAGVASTLFLVTKCIIQIPFSKYVDNHKEKTKSLLFGTFFIAIVPFIYILAKNVNGIYFAQIFYGIGAGLAYPSWLGLFSANLDRKHESYEWSLYFAISGLGTAAAAIIGAAIAELIGFTYTFAIVGVISLIGCFILFGLNNHDKKPKKFIKHYHQRRKLSHRKYPFS